MRLGLRLGIILVAVGVIAWLPTQLGNVDRETGATVGVYFMAVLGLNILTGYTGQISIGNGAFMAIGGYTTAILTAHHGWNDLATLPIAALLGFGCGVVVGLPALRLSGAYLALLTFAVALAVPQLAKNYSKFTGGTQGLPLPSHSGLWLYTVSWTLSGILLLAAWLLLRGRTGRAFRAVRDSEIAAASSGISLPIYKTLAFGISAAFAAVAGSMYVLVIGFVNPDSFALTVSLFILIGAAVGGFGSLWGVIVGAAFIVLVQKTLMNAPSVGGAQGAQVIFGLTLILVMLLFPGGAAQFFRRLAGLTNRARNTS
jgi:branched-chain amino acid transport system permease protein